MLPSHALSFPSLLGQILFLMLIQQLENVNCFSRTPDPVISLCCVMINIVILHVEIYHLLISSFIPIVGVSLKTIRWMHF